MFAGGFFARPYFAANYWGAQALAATAVISPGGSGGWRKRRREPQYDEWGGIDPDLEDALDRTGAALLEQETKASAAARRQADEDDIRMILILSGNA